MPAAAGPWPGPGHRSGSRVPSSAEAWAARNACSPDEMLEMAVSRPAGQQPHRETEHEHDAQQAQQRERRASL